MMDVIIPVGLLLLLLLGGGGGGGGKKADDPNKPDEPKPDEPKPDEPTPDTPAPTVYASPKAGGLYQVRAGDTGELRDAKHGIAHMAITDRIYSLEIARNTPHDQALARASAMSTATSRANYWLAVECLPFNDRLYGTFGYGPKAHPASNGRAIRLTPVHARNAQALATGLPLARRIALKTPNDRGKGNATGSGSAYEMLLLPDIDNATYLASNTLRFTDPTTAYLREYTTTGVPPGVQWGC